MRLINKYAKVGNNIYFKTIHEQNASKTLWKNKNVKSVDQLWLARQFAEYASVELMFPNDELLYNTDIECKREFELLKIKKYFFLVLEKTTIILGI